MRLQSLKNEIGEFVSPIPFVLEPDDYEGIFDNCAREYARQYIDPYMGRPIQGNISTIPVNLKTPEELAKLDQVNNFIRRLNGVAQKLRENFFQWHKEYIGKGETLRYSFHEKDFFVVPEGEIKAQPAPVEPEPREEECKPEFTMEFPDTMEGLRKAVFPMSSRGAFESKYDFGKFAISKPSSDPSPVRSEKMVEKYHLFAIARALIARKGGKEYPTDVVIRDTLLSLESNAWMKKYVEKVKENGGTIEAPGLYKTYLDSPVTRSSKKFLEAAGQKWDIGLFIIELTDNLHIKLKRKQQ